MGVEGNADKRKGTEENSGGGDRQQTLIMVAGDHLQEPKRMVESSAHRRVGWCAQTLQVSIYNDKNF